jgi:acyl dehydratase
MCSSLQEIHSDLLSSRRFGQRTASSMFTSAAMGLVQEAGIPLLLSATPRISVNSSKQPM